MHSGVVRRGHPQPGASRSPRSSPRSRAPDGRIRIPGFYDDVRRADRRRARGDGGAARSTRRPIARPSASPRSSARPATPTLERRSTRPTLDVNGIWGGFQGDGAKTIIPAHAHAKVSCRLVRRPGSGRHLRAPARLRRGDRPARRHGDRPNLGGGRPSHTPIDHPVTQAAGARALEAVFGRPPLFAREGGSIPVAADFELDPRPAGRAARLHPAHDNAHAPNEWMDLANYEAAIRAIVRTFDEIAALDGRECGTGRCGWVIRGPRGATLRPPHRRGRPSCLRGGIAPREH